MYSPVTQLTPGMGYWVKSNGAGKLVLANPLLAGLSKESTSGGIDVAAVLNSLTLSDSKGGAQTLYFGPNAKAQIPLMMYAIDNSQGV